VKLQKELLWNEIRKIKEEIDKLRNVNEKFKKRWKICFYERQDFGSIRKIGRVV